MSFKNLKNSGGNGTPGRNFAIKVVSYDTKDANPNNHTVTGVDLATGKEVKVALSEKRTYNNRPTIKERQDGTKRISAVKKNGLMVVSAAYFDDKLGAWSARGTNVADADGKSKVAVVIRGMGKINHLQHTGEGKPYVRLDLMKSVEGEPRKLDAIAVTSAAELSKAVASAFAWAAEASKGFAMPKAIVRGMDDNGDVAYFEILGRYNKDEKKYDTAEIALAKFAEDKEVFVPGISFMSDKTKDGTKREKSIAMNLQKGADLMNEIGGEGYKWEVIPALSAHIGSKTVEASIKNKMDLSSPYRMNFEDKDSKALCILDSQAVIGDVEGSPFLMSCAPVDIDRDQPRISLLYSPSNNIVPTWPREKTAPEHTDSKAGDELDATQVPGGSVEEELDRAASGQPAVPAAA